MKRFLSCLILLALAVPLSAREVVDMAGRTVEVPQKIERVLAPYRVAADMVFALQAADLLVGMAAKPSPVMQQLYGPISEVGIANRHSSIEEFLKLKPSIVFMRPGPKVERLSEAGIKVYCLQVEDPASMLEGLKLMGDVLGRTAEAEAIAQYYHQKLQYIETQTARVKDRRRVYLVGPNDVLTTVAGDFYQDSLVRQAGGINVASALRGGFIEVSREHLIAWDPDIIVGVPYSNLKVADIKASDGLQVLRAVQQERIAVFPNYLDGWDLPTPESILGIMWLASQLYPQQVRFDMAAEACEFYTRFYGGYPVEIRL